jgi:hypothetical protein
MTEMGDGGREGEFCDATKYIEDFCAPFIIINRKCGWQKYVFNKCHLFYCHILVEFFPVLMCSEH